MYLARTDSAFPFSRVTGGSVVTIGAFDGLHLGHRRLLERVLEEAVARDLAAIVMSFEPTPKEYFAANDPPARLTRFREKFIALDSMGFDVFYCPKFDAEMRNISADTFIRKLLIHALNVRHLVIGDDFVFARNREGNLEQLQRAGRALDFSVEDVPSVMLAGERVSSTAIRNALRGGEMQRARLLLGRYYRMSGKVMRQERRPHDVPAIFVNLQRRESAVRGVFAVKVGGIAEKSLDAVACIGRSQANAVFGSYFALHIPQCDHDVGGAQLDVDFIARVSDQEDFDTVEKLVDHMVSHMARASLILSERPT
ncbi:MAG: bifunctional riboflavin kinase/FAD synthetase [Gammaproteobacteria bacterium]|nr:bifunctional riboflavin kinase/FAD synthetase [Gammaproteobacteria bacterium]